MKVASDKTRVQMGVREGFRVLRRFVFLVAVVSSMYLLTHSVAYMAPEKKVLAQPKSGWIFVADSNDKTKKGQILLVDPDQGQVVTYFQPGYAPDIALSPDGTRLFVESTLFTQDQWGQDVLEVIDTRSGKVIHSVKTQDHVVTTTTAYTSFIATSYDGRHLYIFKNHQTRNNDEYYVATYDVENGRFLPEKAPVPDCGVGSLFLQPQSRELNVLCPGTFDMRVLAIDDNGIVMPKAKTNVNQPASRVALSAKAVKEYGRKPAVLLPPSAGRSSQRVIMQDGRLLEIDNNTLKIARIDNIRVSQELVTKPAGEGLKDRWVRIQPLNLTPAMTQVYLGVGLVEAFQQGDARFSEIAVLDLGSLDPIKVIKPNRKFDNFTISKDGRHIYLVDSRLAEISVVDAETSEVLRSIKDVGRAPAFAISVP